MAKNLSLYIQRRSEKSIASAVICLSEKVILLAENIWKRYPGVIAVKNVTMKVKEAEILGLVGENGAGKSTLLKILTGVIRRDSGKIYWFGKIVEFSSPLEALKHGLMYIPQDIVLVGNLSLAENIFLGTEKKWLFKPRSEAEELAIASELFKELGVNVNPMAKGSSVGAAIAQLTLIARALYFKAKLIAFDEPTSALGPFETEQLLNLMLKLRSMGISIIFVSHKIEEVMKVADRIYVMRDGEIVKEFTRDQFNINEIIRAMIAREVKEFFPKQPVEIGDKVLEVRNLSDYTGFIKNVSFYVRKGEILGIYGIVGSGRTEMAQTLIGYRRKASGEILLEGKPIVIEKPFDAIKNGIVYLPEDWRLALVYLMCVKDNITLSIANSLKLSELGLVSPVDMRKEHEIVKSFIEKLRIVPKDPYRKTMYLSGGNRQKVAVAKLLATGAKVLILDEPTHGIDVGAKVEIRKLMVELAREGKAIILISSELPEVLNMSDRILVMRNGTIVAEFRKEEASEQKVAEAAILNKAK